MRPLGQAVLLALIGVATAASAQTRAPRPAVPLPPPTIFGAPTTPAPVAPPTNPGSAIAPPAALSPLLSNPGAIYGIPERAGPSYPASPVPAPVDQQKMQSYRNDLINQRFQLDRQSVSPDNRRYREIQRQLNQPGLR